MGKKKKRTPVLNLYKHLCETKVLRWHNGLCNEISQEVTREHLQRFRALFQPTEKEERELAMRGLNEAYWATEIPSHSVGINSEFCGTRETFLLLFACTEGEL